MLSLKPTNLSVLVACSNPFTSFIAKYTANDNDTGNDSDKMAIILRKKLIQSINLWQNNLNQVIIHIFFLNGKKHGEPIRGVDKK
jgi:hypothetical protein